MKRLGGAAACACARPQRRHRPPAAADRWRRRPRRAGAARPAQSKRLHCTPPAGMSGGSGRRRSRRARRPGPDPVAASPRTSRSASSCCSRRRRSRRGRSRSGTTAWSRSARVVAGRQLLPQLDRAVERPGDVGAEDLAGRVDGLAVFRVAELAGAVEVLEAEADGVDQLVAAAARVVGRVLREPLARGQRRLSSGGTISMSGGGGCSSWQNTCSRTNLPR